MGHPKSDTSSTQNAKEPSIWSIIAPVDKQIYTGMAVSVISAMYWFAALMLMWPILQELTSSETDTRRVWKLLAASLICVVIAFVTRVGSFLISHLAAFELEETLRTELSSHLAQVPLGYVVNTGSGALKKVLLDDVRSLHIFVADSTPLFAKAFATPIIGTILMFVIDWKLALLSLVLFPIAIVGLRLAFRDYEKTRIRVDAATEKINSVVLEYVQGMQVVRTFDDGTSSFSRYQEALHNSTETMREWTQKTQEGAFFARTLLAALPTLLVVIAVGTPLVINGHVELASLIMMLIFAPTIAESIAPIIWLQQLILNSSAAVKRINQLRAVPALEQPSQPSTPKDASVEFQNVDFAYSSRDTLALENVSFTIAPATVTALVGPSGAGKSTIAQLILRFWDVDSGSVKIGGVDVRDMTSETLMRNISFVFQSPFLLHDSILENIRLARPEATIQEVQKAAEAAQAHDFICELENGYDTIVGERGGTLSGGQRQRITIARAILQDNPIIVLDEATAFADPDNESKIHAGLAELARGKTLIVIAHRLATVKDAHQIVVMDSGRIAEVGTHEQLLEKDGIYSRLWSNYVAAQRWGLRAEPAGHSSVSVSPNPCPGPEGAI